MTYASFKDYESAKMEIIGGVKWEEDTLSPNQSIHTPDNKYTHFNEIVLSEAVYMGGDLYIVPIQVY